MHSCGTTRTCMHILTPLTQFGYTSQRTTVAVLWSHHQDHQDLLQLQCQRVLVDLGLSWGCQPPLKTWMDHGHLCLSKLKQLLQVNPLVTMGYRQLLKPHRNQQFMEL
mmetsp:Transcript_90002/g.178918  ORF Transcript_90002/g.178918 Transcript_90002/m.178918 type:complete len:108 (-) Transcript_90002:909-1232(-)